MATIGHAADGSAVTIDPARLVSTRMLVQANSGGGKSWMLRVLCERLGKSTPLIVLDWEGEFASLREKLDVLLVGREGEIPTAIATAGALATQILEIGVSAVIDLYDLKLSERRVYVQRFLESMMAAPKRLWSPRLVIVDEAHNLCPEKGDAESADAVRSLASAGRKRDFCAILATQRLSKLSKDAAAETNNKLIGRCTLDVDQNRALDELGMARTDRALLRDLDAGQFYAFGPAFNFKGVALIKGAEVQTTHGHHKGGQAKPPEPSARMSRVADQLRDLAERSKTEVLDLDSARATIRDLRKQLKQAEKAPAPVAGPSPKAGELRAARAEVARCTRLMEELVKFIVNIQARDFDPAVDQEALKAAVSQAAERAVKIIEAGLDARRREVRALKEQAARLIERVQALPPTPKDITVDLSVAKQAPFAVAARTAPRPPRPTTNGHAAEPPEGLTHRHAAVLTAIRLCHGMGYDQPTREQVSFWACKRGGNFNNLLGALRSAGQIDYPTEGTVRALTDGEVPDAGEAYEKVMAALSSRHRLILEAVLAANGPISRDDLSAETGKSGGNFNNLLGALRTAGLVTYPSQGTVDAAPWLRELSVI